MSLLYILLDIGCGYTLIRAFSLEGRRGEAIIYSGGAGAVIISLLMFFSSFVTGDFLMAYGVIFIVATIGIILLGKDIIKSIVKEGERRGRLYSEIVVFSVLMILLWLHDSRSLPFSVEDAWGSYGIKAKMFFLEQRINLAHFRNGQFFLFLRHPFYPLNLALNETFLATLYGIFDERILKIISLEFGLMCSSLVYIRLKKYFSLLKSILFTFAFAFTPMVILHTAGFFAGLSDIMVTFYNFAAVVLFWEFLTTKDKRWFFLSSFFAAAALWTKFEGFIYIASIIIGGGVLFFGKNWLFLGWEYMVIPVMVNIFWWIIKFFKHLEFSYTFVKPYLGREFLAKLWLFLYILSREVFNFDKWGTAWIIIVILFIINKAWRNKGALFYAVVLLLEIAIYITVLTLIASWGSLKERISLGPPLSLERFLLQLLPLVFILIATIVKEDISFLRQRKSEENAIIR